MACLSTAFGAADERPTPPNIVLIFADDLGWKDVGYQGSDFIETPNLDRLAREGMVFSSGYAAAGNCAPSRACLLSGTYTPRHHVFAVNSTDRGQKSKQRLVPIPTKSGLPVENVTVADALKAAGYTTGHFGKWHLAGRGGAKPREQGFDVSFDSFGEGERPEGSESNLPGPPSDPKGVFTLTRKACEFIESNKDRPFFCYLAHHAIHSPLQGRPESLAKFNAKTRGKQHKDPLYAACTYDLDASVGMLLEKLEELSLAENTLLVFTSDNGAVQASSQEPLRGSKGGYYEGGIREPFLVRWPAVTKPGTTSDVPVINVDLYPTFLAAAGAAVPKGKQLDGVSLLPLLEGKGTLARESIFWHFPGYLDGPVKRGRELDVRTGFRSRPVSVIRKGDWKLHLYHEEWQLDGGRDTLATSGAVELYDLARDKGERNNVANAHPEKRDELLADLLDWIETTAAPMAAKPDKPNVIFILSDDLAQGDVGAYGQKLIHTPHLDRMAREGMRFTQAYCGTSVCAPSRTSLMIGKHMGHSPVRANREIKPEGQLPLPEGTYTVANLFKSQGYTTAAIGKWGMGMFDTTGSPLKVGFDHFYGYNCQRHAHSYFPSYLYDDDRRFELPGNGRNGVGKTYAQELIAAESVKWITANKDKPFFLFYAITLPHGRHEIDSQGIYADKDWTQLQKNYAAQVTRLDSDIGRILDTLKTLDLDDKTLVIMSGDNGSSFAPDSEIGKLFDQTLGGKLRGFKRGMYEGALRQACIARWPGVIPAGRVCDEPWAFWDFLPTCADILNTKLPDGVTTDGLSILPLLEGGTAPKRDAFYWELHEGKMIQAARFGDIKAVRNGPRAPIEIYDLSKDVAELNDLAKDRPDLVAQAETIMRESRVDDPNFPVQGERSPRTSEAKKVP